MKRIPQFLRRALRSTGFDVKRYAPLENPHLRRQKVLEAHGVELVIDGGANRGQYGQRLREYGFRGRVLSFEPGQRAFDELCANADRDPHWEARRVALGRSPGHAELLICANSVSSSLKAPTVVEGANSDRVVVGRETVEVVTLEAVLTGERVTTKACLVKLDVQGSEFEALEGAGPRLSDCDLLEIELAFFPQYEGQALALELLKWLSDRGFGIVGVAPNTLDRSSGHVVECDVLLARV
jgi:FkbM family methyltransferase